MYPGARKNSPPDLPQDTRWFATLRRGWLWLIVIFGLGFIVISLLKNHEILAQKFTFSLAFFIATVASYLVYWVVACALWQRLLCWLLRVRVSFGEAFLQLTLVSIGKYVPGKVWGMAARGSYLQQHAVDWRSSTLATVVEQTAILHSAVVHSLCVAGLLENGSSRGHLFLTTAVLTLLLGVAIHRPFVRAATKTLQHARHAAPAEFTVTLSALNYFFLVCGFLLVWTLIGTVFAGLYFTCFGAKLELDLWLVLILSNTVGITAGFLALFAPGGIGIREGVGSAILSGYLPVADAISVCVLFRFWTVTVEFVIAVIVFSLVGLKAKRSIGKRSI